MSRRNIATTLGMNVLLPILTTKEPLTFVDRRIIHNDSSKPKTSPPDCMSTTALLTLRGLGAGLAWTLAVDAYLLASMPSIEWSKQVANWNHSSSLKREFAKSFGGLCKRNMLGFAGFLGIFAGVSCSLEIARGKNDLFNSFAGGFTAGMVFLWQEVRTPRALLISALMCGSTSMVLHHFVPAMGDNSNEGALSSEYSQSHDRSCS
ncbi:putative mitochondrial import inner membrane translocase subunit TIM22 [Plasmopara halstedii]